MASPYSPIFPTPISAFARRWEMACKPQLEQTSSPGTLVAKLPSWQRSSVAVSSLETWPFALGLEDSSFGREARP